MARDGFALVPFNEFEAGAFAERADLKCDDAELAVAPGLPPRRAFAAASLANRFAYRRPALADGRVNLELAQQSIDEISRCKLTHAARSEFAASRDDVDSEGRGILSRAYCSDREFPVGFGLGSMAIWKRIGDTRSLQHDRMRGPSQQRISRWWYRAVRRRRYHPHRSRSILRDRSVHLEQTAATFALLLWFELATDTRFQRSE